MNFFIFFISFFTVAFSFIILISLFKNCTLAEATKIMKNSLKEIFAEVFDTTPAKIFYPSIVGYDGMTIKLDLVNNAFESVAQNFKTCFCTRASVSKTGDEVGYFFDISRNDDSISKQDLLKIIKKQSEKILSNNLQYYGIFMPTSPMVCVALNENELRIAFARTQEGIRHIADYNRKMYFSKNTHKKEQSFEEKWHE